MFYPGADQTMKIRILEDILKLTKEAWDTPVYGRDLAYSLCDIIRMEGLLDQLIANCSSQNRDLLLASANLLEQVSRSVFSFLLIFHFQAAC